MTLDDIKRAEMQNVNNEEDATIVDPNVRNREMDKPIMNPNMSRRMQQASTSPVGNGGVRDINPAKEFGLKTSRELFEESDAAKIPEERALDGIDAAIERRTREVLAAQELYDSVDGDITQKEMIDMTSGDDEFRKMLETGNVPNPYGTNKVEPMRVEMPEEAIESIKATTGVVETPEPDEYDIDAELERELGLDDDSISEMNRETSKVTPISAEERAIRASIPMEPEHQFGGGIIDDTEPEPEIKKAPRVPKSLDQVNIVDNNEDLDLEELDREIEEASEDDIADRRLEKLKADIKAKIRPVTAPFNISTYTVISQPVSINNAINTANMATKVKEADWPLFHSKTLITMREFMGPEIDKLRTLAQRQNSINSIKTMYQMFYDHITSPKPATFDEWIRSVNVMDVEDLFAAAYRASYEDVNFLPYECSNEKCDNSFLSDNIPFMNMVKFRDDEAKKEFYDIYNSEPSATFAQGISPTEIVPISDNFAIRFRIPSINESLIKPAYLSKDFIDKYGDLVGLNTYIEEIYKIDHMTHRIAPLDIKKFPNNTEKTLKARIIALSKIIKTLNSDQYMLMATYINNFVEDKEPYTFVTPAADCSKCGAKIDETIYRPSALLFLRHQLTALANG